MLDNCVICAADRLRSCSDGKQDGVEGIGKPLRQWAADRGAGEESYWLLGMDWGGGFSWLSVVTVHHSLLRAQVNNQHPRVPVKNRTAAGSGVASVPLNLHPHPSPTREPIRMHARGDDWGVMHNWNWRIGGGSTSLLNVFAVLGHF